MNARPTDPIRILFCVDTGYLVQAGVALSSVLENGPDDTFEIYLASFERDTDLCSRIFAPILARHPRCTLRYCDLDGRMVEHLPATRRFSRSIYTRILLGRFIPPGHERILYMDADIVVCASLRPLFDAPLGGAVIGAVADPFRLDPEEIGFTADEPYFNSGVILFDMAAWRARDCEARVLEVLARQGDRLPWMDQDALNIALKGDVRFLDLGWNFQPRCADVPATFLRLAEEDYAGLRAHPRVVHYTTSLKPWSEPHRVHYSGLFRAAAERAGLAPRLAPSRASGLAAHVARAKTTLRWHFPRAFRALRRVFRPRQAALMYRARAEA